MLQAKEMRNPNFSFRKCLDPDVLELCICNRGDIRNDRERTTAQKHFAKLLIDSLFWHSMAIWAKGIDEFVHPVWF